MTAPGHARRPAKAFSLAGRTRVRPFTFRLTCPASSASPSRRDGWRIWIRPRTQHRVAACSGAHLQPLMYRPSPPAIGNSGQSVQDADERHGSSSGCRIFRNPDAGREYASIYVLSVVPVVHREDIKLMPGPVAKGGVPHRHLRRGAGKHQSVGNGDEGHGQTGLQAFFRMENRTAMAPSDKISWLACSPCLDVCNQLFRQPGDCRLAGPGDMRRQNEVLLVQQSHIGMVVWHRLIVENIEGRA